ncbi:MAG: outer membrane lipoprotein-sorting protein [Armatimonadetes bacterium]|nr:outer membrane lipoprotein-sorting protein [Armatimonadota bacterium]
MKKLSIGVAIALALGMLASSAWAVSSADILKKVKAAEASLKDFKADMVITEANKKNVSGMGEGYSDILKLEKAIIQYKKPDMIRYDGYAKGIRAAYIQKGCEKLILAAMIRKKENVKEAPGKRQDSLDLGFLTSKLWTDNNVSVVSSAKNSLKLKFDPKAGGADKRHDMVWIDPATLKVLKREKYRGSGEMRVRMVYSDFETLAGKLPIATMCTMYDGKNNELGSVKYKNVKANVGLGDALFSMAQR